MDRRLVGSRQRIENLHAKAIESPVTEDLELQAQIARHLAVLTSGLLEQSLIISLQAYCSKCSQPRIAAYASFNLSRIHNAKFEDILTVLARFDPAWRTYFEQNITQETKDSIDSIVNNRNQIAHGVQANITINTFANYYRSIKKFLNDLSSFLENA